MDGVDGHDRREDQRMRLFKKRQTITTVAERRLRYAVVAMLDATDGDSEWVTDVVELAQYQWRLVNE